MGQASITAHGTGSRAVTLAASPSHCQTGNAGTGAGLAQWNSGEGWEWDPGVLPPSRPALATNPTGSAAPLPAPGVLWPLCWDCHTGVHGRAGPFPARTGLRSSKFVSRQRWSLLSPGPGCSPIMGTVASVPDPAQTSYFQNGQSSLQRCAWGGAHLRRVFVAGGSRGHGALAAGPPAPQPCTAVSELQPAPGGCGCLEKGQPARQRRGKALLPGARRGTRTTTLTKAFATKPFQALAGREPGAISQP